MINPRFYPRTQLRSRRNFKRDSKICSKMKKFKRAKNFPLVKSWREKEPEKNKK